MEVKTFQRKDFAFSNLTFLTCCYQAYNRTIWRQRFVLSNIDRNFWNKKHISIGNTTQKLHFLTLLWAQVVSFVPIFCRKCSESIDIDNWRELKSRWVRSRVHLQGGRRSRVCRLLKIDRIKPTRTLASVGVSFGFCNLRHFFSLVFGEAAEKREERWDLVHMVPLGQEQVGSSIVAAGRCGFVYWETCICICGYIEEHLNPLSPDARQMRQGEPWWDRTWTTWQHLAISNSAVHRLKDWNQKMVGWYDIRNRWNSCYVPAAPGAVGCEQGGWRAPPQRWSE